MAEAALIDGKALAARVTQEVTAALARLRTGQGIVPGLATLLVGDDPASRVYVGSKTRACAAAGITAFQQTLPGDASQQQVLDVLAALNADERVDGILVQLPLPSGIDSRAILEAIDPAKDVDGFHPINVGRLWSGERSLVPCTPQGCMMLLRSAMPQTAGARAVVVGRSLIVGRPLAALLVQADCTVTLVHSRTRDPAEIARGADIVIAAIGRPMAVTADWIKPGATVIDVGINRVTDPDGKSRLVGDVDFEPVRRVAGAITPVPGGAGPMTIACLLRNTVLAACRRRFLAEPFADS